MMINELMMCFHSEVDNVLIVSLFLFRGISGFFNFRFGIGSTRNKNDTAGKLPQLKMLKVPDIDGRCKPKRFVIATVLLAHDGRLVQWHQVAQKIRCCVGGDKFSLCLNRSLELRKNSKSKVYLSISSSRVPSEEFRIAVDLWWRRNEFG